MAEMFYYPLFIWWAFTIHFNSLLNDKILDKSKFKACADNKIILTQKIEICVRKRLKTLWEKEKMQVTSIFSFSHIVFKSFLFQMYQMSGLCDIELTPS